MLSVDDLPGYFTAVRVFACFALIGYTLLFLTFDNNNGFVTMVTIMLGLMGGYYKDDDQWKDPDPKLGWCYWLAVTCAYQLIKAEKTKVVPKNNKPPAKPKKPAAKSVNTKPGQQNKPNTETKSQNNPNPLPKTETKTQEKPELPTDSRTQAESDSTETPLPILEVKPTSDPSKVEEEQQQQDEDHHRSQRAASVSSSVSLEIDPYDIPELPGLDEQTPAPYIDYQTAADRSDMQTPAVTIPSSSVWTKTRKAMTTSMTFLKNYAKAAVGKRSTDN
ncbi:hypothetical protein ACOMHN_014728 [Nucella lapillus]